ncbi:murein biosynthesis integral membrane protein MurJ, partial [Streptomyces scabiei]|nr:murein biosynthesis integral membrane protein MurJ [Streptomyces scabiei]
MNAPYDGDRGQGAADSGYPDGPLPGPGQVPPQPPADMYLQDAYDQDPYRARDLSAQDPVAEALYDRAAHPPPAPGTYQPQQPLYAQPSSPQYAPDPRVWAQTPAPEPEGPTRHLPYGDDARTTQFVGVDDLVTQAGEERHEPDAFAHLFRDQQQSGPTPVGQPSVPGPAPAPSPGPGRPAYQEPAPAPTPASTPAPAPKKGGRGRRSGFLVRRTAVAGRRGG